MSGNVGVTGDENAVSRTRIRAAVASFPKLAGRHWSSSTGRRRLAADRPSSHPAGVAVAFPFAVSLGRVERVASDA